MSEPHDANYPAIHFVGRLSRGAWRWVSPLLPNRLLAGINAFLKLIRPGRVLMLSSMTWVSASVAGVRPRETWLITLGGMLLAMAGFALDIYSDRHTDKQSPRPWPVNPVSTGMMTASAARRWIIFSVLAGVAHCAAAHPLALLPAAALVLTYWGLAAGTFDGPFGRAITLGLLQALYVLLAAAATGRVSPLMVLVAAVLFSAMVGARAVADIRDLPSDSLTDTRTLAKAYGVRTTRWILPAAVTVASVIALGLYTSGAFDRDYLLWTSLSFGPGVVMAWSFPFRPTPNYAFILGWPFWCVGILYMVALYLGSH